MVEDAPRLGSQPSQVVPVRLTVDELLILDE